MHIGQFGNFNFGLRALSQHQDQTAQSLERLSTGKRINRASDDPSGMIAAELHKTRIYSIQSQLKGFARTETYLGAREGGLSVINDQLIELQSLVVQSANKDGFSEEEHAAFVDEIESIISSIGNTGRNYTFNGQHILSEYGSGSIVEELNSIVDLVRPGEDQDLEEAQRLVEQQVNSVASTRGAIGTKLKSIDSQRSVLSNELINLSDSLSIIEDTDFAKESAALVRSQILEQAAIMTIDVNRQSAENVLGLLESAIELAKAI